MKTVTILIFTFLLSPWTVHANGEAEETRVIESFKTVQTETIDRQATEQTAVQPADTTGKHRLIQTARERGTVRIIVTYKMENYNSERHLSQGQRMAQRWEIEQMHESFVQLIKSEQLKIHIGRKLELSPNIALTVDEEALRFLFNSPIIGRIDENRSGARY